MNNHLHKDYDLVNRSDFNNFGTLENNLFILGDYQQVILKEALSNSGLHGFGWLCIWHQLNSQSWNFLHKWLLLTLYRGLDHLPQRSSTETIGTIKHPSFSGYLWEVPWFSFPRGWHWWATLCHRSKWGSKIFWISWWRLCPGWWRVGVVCNGRRCRRVVRSWATVSSGVSCCHCPVGKREDGLGWSREDRLQRRVVPQSRLVWILDRWRVDERCMLAFPPKTIQQGLVKDLIGKRMKNVD